MVLNHHLRHGDDMTLITFEDGKAVMRDGKVGTEHECCCGDLDPGACPEGVYVNGPTFTYEWDAALSGWTLVGITPQDANQACFDFADANGLFSGGASSPPFNGAFDGEQVTIATCLCGS